MSVHKVGTGGASVHWHWGIVCLRSVFVKQMNLVCWCIEGKRQRNTFCLDRT